MRDIAPGPMNSPVEAAAYWDARLRLPSADDEDRRRFGEWLGERPDHKRLYDELQQSLSMLRQAAGSHPELRAMRDSAHEAASGHRPLRRYGAIAAVLIAMVAGTVTLAQFDRFRPGALKGAGTEPTTVITLDGPHRIYSTAVGERSTVTLADGSRLTLNTASRVAVSLEADQRSLVVLAGQALFEVAHDPAKPFVVRAGDKTVTAHGTVFDVRLRERGMEVTLVEGRVTVAEAARGKTTALADLSPGQQFVSTESGALVRGVNVDSAVSWQDGRVFFDDQTLGSAVAEMNRYSATQIIVDPAVAGLRINGMFRAGQQTRFAGDLEAYLPIDVTVVSDDRIELRPRP